MVEPGNYQIVNMAIGGNLAVTYRDKGLQLRAEALELGEVSFQTWVVTGNPGAPQSISPLRNPNLQVHLVDNVLQPTEGNFTWRITVADGVVLIKTTNQATSWAMALPRPRQRRGVLDVIPVPEEQGLTEWNFLPVSGH